MLYKPSAQCNTFPLALVDRLYPDGEVSKKCKSPFQSRQHERQSFRIRGPRLYVEHPFELKKSVPSHTLPFRGLIE
jgi:NAD(P)H-flavin reductase